jgi:ribosomal protein L11 methyltransferase
MKQRTWVQLTLTVPESRQDLLIGQLAALGFEGFLQEEEELKCYTEKSRWNGETDLRLKYCLQQFHKEFPALSLRRSTASVRKENWNRIWERSIGIVDIPPNIIIKPSWKALRARDKGKIVLQIDPKMSFGTGQHETTRLCLRLMQEHLQPGMNVLDFGSGTGILAIAAAKLGAKRCVAVDNDCWTIPNIRENLKRNHAEKRVKAILGDERAIPSATFDLIVANIDLPTITRVYRKFVRRLAKGGLLILSGILTNDLLRLHTLLEHSGVTPIDIVEENEWAAIVLVNV